MGEYIEEKRKMDPLVKPEDDGIFLEGDDGGLGGMTGVWGAENNGGWKSRPLRPFP
jgi:hypothetical protein